MSFLDTLCHKHPDATTINGSSYFALALSVIEAHRISMMTELAFIMLTLALGLKAMHHLKRGKLQPVSPSTRP